MTISRKLATELETNEFPERFARFENLIGPKSWLKRSRLIAEEAKGNRLLAPYLHRENQVALALSELFIHSRKHGRFPHPLVRSQAHYDACVFVVLFLDIYARAPSEAKRSLLGRTQGAFKNPDDLRALQFEWLTAIHLTKRGFDIEFPELNGAGEFDLLATKNGIATEIECKSISHKKGRQIHRREALEMHALLKDELGHLTRNLRNGLLVRTVVSDRLPKSHGDQKALCRQIQRAVLAGKSVMGDSVDILIDTFDVSSSPFTTADPDQDRVRDFLRGHLRVDNKEVLILFLPNRRAFILSLESKKPDQLLDYTFDTIKDACDRQLSGKRPGVVCVKLEDLTADQLGELGSEIGDATALRIATSRFLNSRRRSHLVCLSFVSDGDLQHADSGTSQEGRSYFFDNPESPFHNPSTVSAFREIE